MRFSIETGTDNDILRKVSDPVNRSEIPKYAALGEDLIKFLKLKETNGVGIAAPQVGISKRLVCVSLLKTYDDESFKTILMINPEIVEYEYDFEVDNEGCLSIPKVFGDVARSKSVKVRYLDRQGKDCILKLSGIAAKIVQHEVDHLNGILFTDKLAQVDEPIGKDHVL